MTGGVERLEGGEGGPRLGHRHLGPVGDEGGGELEPGAGRLEGELSVREAGEGRVQAGRARRPRPRRGTPDPGRGRRRRARWGRPCSSAQVCSCTATSRGRRGVAGGEVEVDQQREERGGGHAGAADLGERPLDDVGGQLVLAADVVQRGDGRGGFDRAAIDAGQQLLGLLEPALPQPELGQPDERGLALALRTDRPEANGVGEGGVGLGPPPGRGEEAAVVGPAERRDVRDLAAGGDRLADADPLVRPPDVVGVLARREQLAEHLGEDEEVVDLAAGDAGERLVEVHHALVDAVVVHEGGAEVGEGVELEVAGAVAAGQVAPRRGSAAPAPRPRRRTSP